MRRGELIANILILGGPLIGMGLMFWGFIVLSVVASAPMTSYYISLALFAIGFVLFFKAKWSLVKNGTLISFGSGLMTKTNRFMYRGGYLLMGIGLIITFVLVLLTK